MQSNGGSISANVGRREPVRTILSGPAAGVVGAAHVARRAGFSRIITFDMGGTSTDVCLVDGKIQTTHEGSIAHCPIGIPTLDIHTVGAGGGSIARVDLGGALAVGPESAGADPGPVCYGRGSQLTVTDANVFLGRLDPGSFLGGNMQLETEKLEGMFTRLASELGLKSGRYSAHRAAQGVVDVANARMEQAIRVISIERGHDSRDFTLVTFGGAGGLHAAELARNLAIPQVLIPGNPGLLSALGALLADITKDYSRSYLTPESAVRWPDIEHVYGDLERQARRAMAAEGCTRNVVKLIRQIDLRYLGQAYELTLPFSRGCLRHFHATHEKRYGYADGSREVEIVTLRVRAVSPAAHLTLRGNRRSRSRELMVQPVKRLKAYFTGRFMDTLLFQRDSLRPGDFLPGPCVVAEYSATTVVPPDFRLEVDAQGNLLLSIRR
jgi:N-methylhydantoinase A